jgi:thiosulfate/3-mercaptopyruvate sulfurtransferase
METGDPLVSADWLKQNIDAPDVRVVDATWVPPFLVGRTSGSEQYDAAHIPNAVYFDIDAIAAPDSDLPHMLPDPVLFSSRVRKLGLGDGNRLVIYDNNGFFAAARVWWMFRAMGHKDVKVLDGGLAAWTAAGGDTEDLPPVAVERHYTARKRADLVKDMEQMRATIDAGAAQILDARAQDRFNGTAPEPRADLKSGHMQGAACAPASSLIGDNGLMKSAANLQSILGDYISGPVITTCGSGVSAAVINLALARLGNWDAALYDGSWTEWASHSENEIITS